MAGWRKRMGRMGNHYANEASLNHTLPTIICWEKPRLLGSLVCSAEGTYFWARPLLLPLFTIFCDFCVSLSRLECLFGTDKNPG